MLPRLFLALCLTYLTTFSITAQNPQSKSETIPLPQLVERFEQPPDYAADQTITLNGHALHKKFAKKGDKIREVFYPLEELETLKDTSLRQYPLIALRGVKDMPVLIDPQAKTYAEITTKLPVSPIDVMMLLHNLPPEMKKAEAVKVGRVTVSGLKATHFHTMLSGETTGLSFYLSEEPAGLLLKFEVKGDPNFQASFSMSNVSFDLPDEWFQIPGDYQQVEARALLLEIQKKAP